MDQDETSELDRSIQPGSPQELEVDLSRAVSRHGEWDQAVDAASRDILSQVGLDAINTMIVIADVRAEDTPLVFVNGFFLEFTGYAASEVLGRNCRFLQQRPDGTMDNEQPGLVKIRRAIRTGGHTRALLRNYRKDGTMFWNELYLSPVHNTQGELTHMLGVQNNVSERITLSGDRDLLNSVVDDNEDAMLITSADGDKLPGRVTHVNRAFSALTGIESHLVTRQDAGSVLTAIFGRSSYHNIERKLIQKERYEGDALLRPRGGRKTFVRYTITPVRGDKNQIVQWCHILRDVTDQRQLEQDVVDIQSYEQARIARDLHDSVAQDLTAAALTCTHLRDRISDPEIKLNLTTIFEDIRDAAHQARSIAHGLTPANVETHGLASSLAMLARRTQEHGLASCEFHNTSGKTFYDPLHEVHLYHIAREAVSNAIRHGHPQQVVIELNVEGDQGRLTVRDNGRGLDDQDEAQGIGVRTMRSRAKLLDGTLEIQPAPGGGVEVICSFPCAPAYAGEEPHALAENE